MGSEGGANAVAWIGVGIVVGLFVVALATLWLMQRWQPPPSPETSPSPVPWLDDAVWRALNPVAPRGRRILWARVVVEPELIDVEQSDRERAPVLALSGRPAPPQGPLAEQRQRLASTPGGGRIQSAVWPLCCERLATLLVHQRGRAELERVERTTGPLDLAYLDGEIRTWGGPNADLARLRAVGYAEILAQIRAGDHDGTGIDLFHCRACGRVYVASCAP